MLRTAALCAIALLIGGQPALGETGEQNALGEADAQAALGEVGAQAAPGDVGGQPQGEPTFEPTGAEDATTQLEASALDTEMENVKQALIELKRDLVILEEDLLFPASSQVAVFLSMDVGDLFALDAVTLKLNGKEVAHHLYTDRQVDALYRGGVQKLYVGNAKQGQNRLTAFFVGRGPNGRDYTRATTVEFEKSFEPTFIELAINDSTAKYQPEFSAAVSN